MWRHRGESAGEQVQPISAEMGGGERTFSRLTLVPSGDGMCDVWQWWETRISPARRPSDGKKINSLWFKIDVSIYDSLRTGQYHTQYHKLTSEKEAPFWGRLACDIGCDEAFGEDYSLKGPISQPNIAIPSTDGTRVNCPRLSITR